MKKRLVFIIFAFAVSCALSAFGQLGFKGFSENGASSENSDGYKLDGSWYVKAYEGNLNCSSEIEAKTDGRYEKVDDKSFVLRLETSEDLTIYFHLPDTAYNVRAVIEYYIPDDDNADSQDEEEEIKGRLRWNDRTLPEKEALLSNNGGGYAEIPLKDPVCDMKKTNVLRIFSASGSLRIVKVLIRFDYLMPCCRANGVLIKLTNPDPVVNKLTPDIPVQWKGDGACDNGWIKIEYNDGIDWRPVPGAESIALGDELWPKPHEGKFIWKKHGLSEFPKLRIVYTEGESAKQKNVRDLELQASALFKQHKYSEALAMIDEALKVSPNNPQLLEDREKIVASLKKWNDTEREANAAKLYEQATDLSDEEKYDEALEKIEKALDIDPDNSAYKKTKRAIVAGQKRVEARRLYQEAEELFDNKKYKDAFVTINQALSLYPDEQAYIMLKHRIRIKLEQQEGEEAQALAEMERQEAEAKAAKERQAQEEKTGGRRKTFSVNGVEFAFRWIPAGTFMMGSPEAEMGRNPDSEKQHQVTLSKGFWMLETEVTQRQWKAVMGNNPSYFKGDDNLPVEQVTWTDCQEFCNRCAMLGLTVQLPTEAQWEYACRAGSTTALPNGNIRILGQNNAPALDPIAWYGGNSSQGYKGQSNKNSKTWTEMQYPGGPCGTHPVGQKEPNAWGLYDMIGNVWEWCADWYGKDYPSESVTDPTGPSTGSDRIFRGGSWGGYARYCRSACRNGDDPKYRNGSLGFRVVKGQ